MTEEQLRALVREAIARHAGAPGSAALSHAALSHVAPSHAAPRTLAPCTLAPSHLAPSHFAPSPVSVHASHALFVVPSGGDADGPCIIEPAVRCNHCGYCKSMGH
jgi:hypothetical protein